MSQFTKRILITMACFVVGNIGYGIIVGLEGSEIFHRTYFELAALAAFWGVWRSEYLPKESPHD